MSQTTLEFKLPETIGDRGVQVTLIIRNGDNEVKVPGMLHNGQPSQGDPEGSFRFYSRGDTVYIIVPGDYLNRAEPVDLGTWIDENFLIDSQLRSILIRVGQLSTGEVDAMFPDLREV